MSRSDNVMEDKFASNAVTFNDGGMPPGKDQFKQADRGLTRTAPVKVDTGDLEGFTSVSQRIAEEKAAEKKPDGLIARKMKRIFGAGRDMKNMFFQGFKMGAIVGGIFGGLTGLYYAIQTRSFMYIPMIALTSGGSFGFFMGVGMVMRSEMAPKVVAGEEQEEDALYQVTVITGEAGVQREPLYQKWYSSNKINV